VRKIKSPLKKHTIVALPGGPGLGADTLAGLEELANSFNVFLVDPPGTGGKKLVERPTYDDLLYENWLEVCSVQGSKILVGHSFGGIQAVDIFLKDPTQFSAIILVAAPFSPETFAGMDKQYQKLITPGLKASEDNFYKNPTDENYANWFSKYCSLCFIDSNIDRGARLFRSDNISGESFMGASDEMTKRYDELVKMKNYEVPKLFISGEKDLLVLPELSKKDAEAGGFKFEIIDNAGHFVFFDQPLKVHDSITQFINSSLGGI
jgi:pimeloyl-ACP methyl ester carboxylesterase